MCTYVNEHVFYEHKFAPKIFKIFVALCGTTVYYVIKQGRKGATVHSRNEVTQMIIYSGSHVKETFSSAFKTLVNGLAKAHEPVIFKLNMQDDDDASIICRNSSAYAYIKFINALDVEVSVHGVAIVIATDYRPNIVETTIFVVCDDD